ncbi:MAG: hypothetical protein V3W44_10950 [Dehalococcoidales bacterium]
MKWLLELWLRFMVWRFMRSKLYEQVMDEMRAECQLRELERLYEQAVCCVNNMHAWPAILDAKDD